MGLCRTMRCIKDKKTNPASAIWPLSSVVRNPSLSSPRRGEWSFDTKSGPRELALRGSYPFPNDLPCEGLPFKVALTCLLISTRFAAVAKDRAHFEPQNLPDP